MPGEFEYELIALTLSEQGSIILIGEWWPGRQAVQTATCCIDGYYWTNNQQFDTSYECAVYLCRNLSSVDSYA